MTAYNMSWFGNEAIAAVTTTITVKACRSWFGNDAIAAVTATITVKASSHLE